MKSLIAGEMYTIETEYLDYDGKKFGMAQAKFDLKEFKGVRKITSLPLYPLKYHTTSEALKSQLLERGKRFTTLDGMQYKSQQGMAYLKVKGID